MNKLKLNQEVLKKNNELDATEIYLLNKNGDRLPSSIIQKYCLNCDEVFKTTRADTLFCTSKCADEYNKRRMGLL